MLSRSFVYVLIDLVSYQKVLEFSQNKFKYLFSQ
jgi:hypothetical protein